MTPPADPWNLVDLEGRLGRPVRSDQWWVPAAGGVQFTDAEMWVTGEGFADRGRVSGSRNLLEQFARLHSLDGAAIARFAGRWGFLHTCSHGIAAGHWRVAAPATLGAANFTLEIPDDCHPQPREPFSVWRYWSSQAWGLLSAATRLRDGGRPSAAAWAALHQPGPWIDRERVVASSTAAADWMRRQVEGSLPIEVERDAIALAATSWLRLAGVGLEVRWESGHPDVAMRVGGLFGGIGLQVALALGDVDGWGVCDGCGTFHIPRRPQAAGRRSFCESCRETGVPARLASRTYRAKKRSSRAREHR